MQDIASAVELIREGSFVVMVKNQPVAWANHIMQQGRVAFYSHLHDNLPSQALAQSLGVVQYAVSAGYN